MAILKQCTSHGLYEPGNPPIPGGRCPTCYKEHANRKRRPRKQRGYTEQWLRMVKQAILRHPYCAECGATEDLTGDHIVPLSKGGTNTPSNVRVLCRRCNSSRGNRQGVPKNFTAERRTRPPVRGEEHRGKRREGL